MANTTLVLAPGEVLTVTAGAVAGTLSRMADTPGAASQSDESTVAASASLTKGNYATQTTWQFPRSFTYTVAKGSIAYTDAIAGVTTGPAVVKIAETITFDQFTDGGAAVGTYTVTKGSIPAGATFLHAAIPAVVGFAGDTSATAQLGDGTDVDRYNTGTPDVFSTAAGGVAAGAPSGTTYHAAAKTPVVTITTNADWTSVTAGSITVEFYYTT